MYFGFGDIYLFPRGSVFAFYLFPPFSPLFFFLSLSVSTLGISPQFAWCMIRASQLISSLILFNGEKMNIFFITLKTKLVSFHHHWSDTDVFSSYGEWLHSQCGSMLWISIWPQVDFRLQVKHIYELLLEKWPAHSISSGSHWFFLLCFIFATVILDQKWSIVDVAQSSLYSISFH